MCFIFDTCILCKKWLDEKHLSRKRIIQHVFCILLRISFDLRLKHPLDLCAIQLNLLWRFNYCHAGNMFRGMSAENNCLKFSLVSPHSCSSQDRCLTRRLKWTAGIQQKANPLPKPVFFFKLFPSICKNKRVETKLGREQEWQRQLIKKKYL